MTEKGNNTFHIIMFIAAVLAVLICGDAGWYFLVIVWLLVAVLWFPPAWLKSYPDTKILRNISFKLGITLLTLIIGYTIYNKYFNILCYYELETNTGLYYDKEKKEKEDVKYVDQPFVNTKITIYNAKELKIDDGEKIIPLTYEIQQKFDLEPGENVVAKEIKASNFFETETKIIYETVYYLTANEIAQIKINDKKAGIQAAKEEAENKAYEEALKNEAKYGRKTSGAGRTTPINGGCIAAYYDNFDCFQEGSKVICRQNRISEGGMAYADRRSFKCINGKAYEQDGYDDPWEPISRHDDCCSGK